MDGQVSGLPPEGTHEREGARVLVVEDDLEIAELVAAYLRRELFDADIVGSAEAAVVACAEATYDLVILDLGLPGADGFEFLRRFREGSTAPVIIVSARESDEDKIIGLGLGADDFVSKPFSPKVLAARVKAQLRRASIGQAAGPSSSRKAFGPYVLDYEGKVLEKGAERVPLSRREFELLAFLAAHEGKTFGPEELYRSVWGLEHGDLSTVAVHVQRVRRKIETEGESPRWLVTVPGAGYRFLGNER
jgi:Response regulators consisting of a CheY-like receiver domain and a winged-helix DNA-binding domain